MSKKLLKNIDWIIPVPDNNYFMDKDTFSTEFAIEQNNKITKWKLQLNFKDQGTQHLAVYLVSQSVTLDFDLEMKCILMSEIDTKNIKSVTVAIKGKDWKNGEVWGDNLISHEELVKDENNYITKGKLHLIVVIKEVLQTLGDNVPTDSLEANMNQIVKLDEVFKVMTSDDVRDDTITLKAADGVKLSALKQIIAEKSPVFAAMFETDMVEKSQGFVEIIDFSGKVMEEMLRFMYFGKVHSIKIIDMELYNAAKVYQVEELAKICLISIRCRIRLSNVFKIVEFAYVHDETEIFESCCELICRYFAADNIRKKTTELKNEIQISVLTYLAQSRCDNRIFCGVEAE